VRPVLFGSSPQSRLGHEVARFRSQLGEDVGVEIRYDRVRIEPQDLFVTDEPLD
jgi:hypothetical protein